MANKLYEETTVQDIADAIREKNGAEAKYTVSEMADAIRAINGSERLVEFSQVNPIVAKYIAEVTYSPDDYSASQVLPYVYEETGYEKGHPTGYDVNISESGELHLTDELSVVKMQSAVGINTLSNAVPNKVAHWWNTVDGNVTQNGTIKPTGQVRMINTTANNVRDLGGWTCDGGTIKYGKLFRGGALSETDADVLVEQCQVRHDLDLRGKSENEGLTSSPLGSEITYTCTENYVWYSLGNEDDWKTILGTIFTAAAKNEPVMFHCAAGADRTGTVACIVEAILGVDQAEVDKDFELTSFAIAPNARRRTDANWIGLIDEINAISVGDTFRDKVINWVGYLGFTADEINAFRNAMIDGTPETVTVEEYIPEEPEVNYFNAATATLNARLGSSGTTSTFNGKVTTDFIPWEDGMSGKTFQIGGVTPIADTTYKYYVRICFYDENKTFVSGYSDTSGDVLVGNGLATTYGNYKGGGFARITVTLTDNVTITADDVAALKITME